MVHSGMKWGEIVQKMCVCLCMRFRAHLFTSLMTYLYQDIKRTHYLVGALVEYFLERTVLLRLH